MTRLVAALAFTSVVLHRLRDPVVLFFTVVLPVIVIVIIGTTFGGQGHVEIGLVQLEHGALAARAAAALETEQGIRVHSYPDLASLRRAVRRQTIDAGLVLDAAFDRALSSGHTARLEFVSGPAADRAFTARLAVVGALEPLAARIAAAQLATRLAGGGFAANLALAGRLAGPSGSGVRVQDVGRPQAATLNRFSLTAPQNLVLFVFITTLGTGQLIVQARRSGVLRRALSTRTGVGTILLGLAVGWLAVALVQSAIILMIGAVAFGVDWGRPLPAALLVVDFALVGCGAGLLVGAVGRDEDRVGSVTPIVGLVLGALGGCMVPLEVFPAAMSTLAHLTPHYWAVRSWQELVFHNAGVA
ncbi:MAG: ABC transporter permease, partial [Gaiellales bacterium]